MTSPENLGNQFDGSNPVTPLKPTHFVPIPYTTPDGTTGYSKIINQGGRHTVLVNLRGTKVPFYISTGMGGKETVEEGKWFPYFGRGSDGWLNKADEQSINAHYGSKHLKSVADWLNTHLGDTRGPDRGLLTTDDGSGVPYAGYKGPHTAALNADLNPVKHDSEAEPLIKNIKDTLYKIHNEPKLPTTEYAIQHSALLTKLKEHANRNPELNLGIHLP